MEPTPEQPDHRQPQLAYSELQHKTHDADKRRRKARKIVSVLKHFLGTGDLAGLRVLDIGASTGYTVEALVTAGAEVTGVDIDAPGIAFAKQHFGDRATFLVADGAELPMDDQSFDVVVLNHIYEHVVDADAVMAEIRRVLRPDGLVYLGLGNKYGVIEPHYRLPFLSWVPRRLADRYVSAFNRADHYYEQFRSRRALVEMCRPLRVWDYTYTLLAEPERFHATDVMPAALARLPVGAIRALEPVMPTFIWIGTPGDAEPVRTGTRRPPERIN